MALSAGRTGYISRSELAEELDITPQTLRKWALRGAYPKARCVAEEKYTR